MYEWLRCLCHEKAADVRPATCVSRLTEGSVMRRDQPEWWADLARRNMRVDCSWEQAAGAYADVYARLAAM